MEPLVSVIIPVYNVAPYLREALNSVIRQTYRNLQIIIIDDGSTDASGLICDEYKRDHRVTLIHQENRGLSSARNVGLDRINGAFVAFLDPDDAYHPKFIENLLDVMIHEKPDIAICKYVVSRTTENMRLAENNSHQVKPILKNGEFGKAEALWALAEGRLNTSVWNKLYSRKLWKEIRFPDGQNYEDIDVIFRILNACKSVYMIDQALYFHRRRPGSITQTDSKKNINDRNLAYSHLDAFVETHTPGIFTEDQRQRYRQVRLNRLIVQFIKLRERGPFHTEMRNEIIAAGKEIKNLRIKTKAAYYMVCHCPWLLKIVYPVCLPLRLIRVMGSEADRFIDLLSNGKRG